MNDEKGANVRVLFIIHNSSFLFCPDMFYNLLYLVPKNWASRAVGALMERRWPLGLDRRLRDAMIRAFKPEVGEAEHPLDRYPTWSAFFTRRLRPGARPLGASPIVAPVDGTLTERGRLENVNGDLYLTQIKGLRYTLKSLLAGWDAAPYAGGAFLTVYLAPYNYHRIHAPADCRVLRARHVAGALWPVNRWSVRSISELFVRNDRILVEMDAGIAGRMTIALVGATNVGRTTLAFSDLRGNVRGRAAGYDPAGIRDFTPAADLPEIKLAKGDDLACFEMGSTIVLVLDAAGAALLRPELLAGPEGASAPLPVLFGSDWAVTPASRGHEALGSRGGRPNPAGAGAA
jgi:phosphatidylserine decarboxylase